MDFIAGLLHEEGYRTLHASYAETPKNHQVSDFYLRCGMQEIPPMRAKSLQSECRKLSISKNRIYRGHK